MKTHISKKARRQIAQIRKGGQWEPYRGKSANHTKRLVKQTSTGASRLPDFEDAASYMEQYDYLPERNKNLLKECRDVINSQS